MTVCCGGKDKLAISENLGRSGSGSKGCLCFLRLPLGPTGNLRPLAVSLPGSVDSVEVAVVGVGTVVPDLALSFTPFFWSLSTDSGVLRGFTSVEEHVPPSIPAPLGCNGMYKSFA